MTHATSKFLAVQIDIDHWGVKFGSYNKSFLAYFEGECSRDNAIDYADFMNKQMRNAG